MDSMCDSKPSLETSTEKDKACSDSVALLSLIALVISVLAFAVSMVTIQPRSHNIEQQHYCPYCGSVKGD